MHMNTIDEHPNFDWPPPIGIMQMLICEIHVIHTLGL